MGGGRSTHTDRLPSRLSHLYLYQCCCGHKILHLLCNKILHLRCSDPCVYSCSPRRAAEHAFKSSFLRVITWLRLHILLN